MVFNLPFFIQLTVMIAGFVFLVFKSYGEGYGKKKGELRAIKEDLEEIIKQQSSQAEAIKTIEARISGDLWNDQELWKQKLEVYVVIVNFWNELTKLLIDELYKTNPDKDSFTLKRYSLENSQENKRALALKNIFFSNVVNEHLRFIESRFNEIVNEYFDWNRTKDENVKMRALLALMIYNRFNNVTRLASCDLRAFGKGMQEFFQKEQRESLLISSAYHKKMKDEPISKEEQEVLEAYYKNVLTEQ